MNLDDGGDRLICIQMRRGRDACGAADEGDGRQNRITGFVSYEVVIGMSYLPPPSLRVSGVLQL